MECTKGQEDQQRETFSKMWCWAQAFCKKFVLFCLHLLENTWTEVNEFRWLEKWKTRKDSTTLTISTSGAVRTQCTLIWTIWVLIFAVEFAQGRPFGKSGLYWLKVHLANLYAGGRLAYHLNDTIDSAENDGRWRLRILFRAHSGTSLEKPLHLIL